MSSISVMMRWFLRTLMDARNQHAVIIFSQSRISSSNAARFVHIFSGPSRAHIVGVTPQKRWARKTIDDLTWLGVTLLSDG